VQRVAFAALLCVLSLKDGCAGSTRLLRSIVVAVIGDDEGVEE
jgi:hypothetical protein